VGGGRGVGVWWGMGGRGEGGGGAAMIDATTPSIQLFKKDKILYSPSLIPLNMSINYKHSKPLRKLVRRAADEFKHTN